MAHTVKLKTTTFVKITEVAGFTSHYALARAMGLNRSTVARVVTGSLQPGTAFIAGALVALAPLSFDDLFEVVTQPTGKAPDLTGQARTNR
ncbi:helix-turn-helix domain-containing protein [Saccharothrix syringae]|uniref:Transcriptional regulator n=1 Tax=Saccharothrix syringae TaxID=103733 RepID=A0A5Q0GYA0_SACSY|nr:hypothetical protein [Saccharothrix syringae]QFZ18470.1 transcriptional regulator [Saccharothrix syringae]